MGLLSISSYINMPLHMLVPISKKILIYTPCSWILLYTCQKREQLTSSMGSYLWSFLYGNCIGLSSICASLDVATQTLTLNLNILCSRKFPRLSIVYLHYNIEMQRWLSHLKHLKRCCDIYWKNRKW